MNWSNTLRRWQRERDDRRLFRYLCDLHRLAPRERKLLLALGEQGRVLRDSEIFVRPALFARSPEPKTWPHHEVAQLHAKLFGVIHVAAPTPPPGYASDFAPGVPQGFSHLGVGPSLPNPTLIPTQIPNPAPTPPMASAVGPAPPSVSTQPAPTHAAPAYPGLTHSVPAPPGGVAAVLPEPPAEPTPSRAARWKRPLDLLRRARSRAETTRAAPTTTAPTPDGTPRSSTRPTSTAPAPGVPGVSFTQVEDPAVPGLPSTWGE